jgi:hypothetical protein
VLDDDSAAWPVQQFLRNFTYERLETHSVFDLTRRLEWLRRDVEGYIPQPYDQLASAYRRAGRDENARKVAVAKQQQRRQVLSPAGKTWNWILYLTIGYGYRTWQAGLWLLALMLIGTTVFAGAYPAQMVAVRQSPMTFSAPIYALDTLPAHHRPGRTGLLAAQRDCAVRVLGVGAHNPRLDTDIRPRRRTDRHP